MGFARLAAVVVAAVVLLVVVIAVAFPYLVLVRIMEHSRTYLAVRAPRAKVSEAYPHLKTGDILLFVSASHLPTNSGLCQTYFSHAAMLTREGDLVYTSEAQMGTELMPNPPGADYRMKKGAASAPMLTRVKHYPGSVYVMRLSRALDPPRERRLKAAADQLHADGYAYPSASQAFFAAVLGRKVAARHCFQHIAHLLDEVGLTPLDREAPLADSGFLRVCREVCGLASRALPDGYYYEPPVELVYDIGALAFDDAA
jgi:hypothetical protein